MLFVLKTIDVTFLSDLMISPTFNFPPLDLELNSNEVHAWKASLDLPESMIQMLEGMLSVDESERAGRFHFEKDRRHFIAGRGLLRAILGWYLNTEPFQLRFRYGKNGKPELADKFEDMPIEFNLSHSDNLACYAFSWGSRVGVDIEHVRVVPDLEQIAERYFSKKENTALRSLSPGDRKEAFFNCWTRKEALLKAAGHGLVSHLNTFEVTLVPGKPAKLVNVVGDLGNRRWSLHTAKPAPEYAGAIAFEGGDRRMKYFSVVGNRWLAMADTPKIIPAAFPWLDEQGACERLFCVYDGVFAVLHSMMEKGDTLCRTTGTE